RRKRSCASWVSHGARHLQNDIRFRHQKMCPATFCTWHSFPVTASLSSSVCYWRRVRRSTTIHDTEIDLRGAADLNAEAVVSGLSIRHRPAVHQGVGSGVGLDVGSNVACLPGRARPKLHRRATSATEIARGTQSSRLCMRMLVRTLVHPLAVANPELNSSASGFGNMLEKIRGRKDEYARRGRDPQIAESRSRAHGEGSWVHTHFPSALPRVLTVSQRRRKQGPVSNLIGRGWADGAKFRLPF